MTRKLNFENMVYREDPFQTNPRCTSQSRMSKPTRQQREFYQYLYNELCEKRGFELPPLKCDCTAGTVSKFIRKAQTIQLENDIHLPKFDSNKALIEEIRKDPTWTIRKKEGTK